MIYVGTCGYAYKEWVGAFYPGTVRKNEMLPFYAAHFRAVEIDASFYGVLPPQTAVRMNAVTPANFRFCFKVPRTLTHDLDLVTPHVHPDAAAFAGSVTPLRDSGKFGAALLQFPNGFKPADEAFAYVRRLASALDPLPLVAEFRNRDWQNARTLELLAELGIGWCNVDMPSYDTLLLPSSDVASPIGYVRFHGRNAAKWWTGDNTTRYDYSYDPDELVPWSDRVAEIEDRVQQTYAFFNNHARGNAARNAEMFSEILRQRYGEAAAEIVPERATGPTQRLLFD